MVKLLFFFLSCINIFVVFSNCNFLFDFVKELFLTEIAEWYLRQIVVKCLENKMSRNKYLKNFFKRLNLEELGIRLIGAQIIQSDSFKHSIHLGNEFVKYFIFSSSLAFLLAVM